MPLDLCKATQGRSTSRSMRFRNWATCLFSSHRPRRRRQGHGAVGAHAYSRSRCSHRSEGTNRELQHQLLTNFHPTDSSTYRFKCVEHRLCLASAATTTCCWSGGPAAIALTISAWRSWIFVIRDRVPLADSVQVWPERCQLRILLPIRRLADLVPPRDEARPLFWPAALGRSPCAGCPNWALFDASNAGPEDPMGSAVWMRVARNPWGPWSRRRQVLDWELDGMGRRNGANHFIHEPEL